MTSSTPRLQAGLRQKKRGATTASRILRNSNSVNECKVKDSEDLELQANNDPLSIRFTNDYNILQVDKLVMAKFERDKNNLPSLEKELQQMKERRDEHLTIGELRILNAKMSELESTIVSISGGSRSVEYQRKSEPLLNIYRGYITSQRASNVEYDRDRILTIIDYLEIAKQYIEIDYLHMIQPQTTMICKGCDNPIDRRRLRDCNESHCPNCGVTRSSSSMGRGMELTTEISTKEYSDEKNFIKAFNRYQGIGCAVFDIVGVCLEIDTYLQSEGYYPASYYRSLPTNKWGKKNGTSLEMINTSLEAIKKTHLYESGNLIGHHLWGWTLFDLQHHREGMISDYRETQEVFEIIPPEEKDRDSSLSTQLRLFRHLQLRGHPCRPCDFKLPTQSDSLRKQDALWKIMCDTVNKRNPNIYYIPM